MSFEEDILNYLNKNLEKTRIKEILKYLEEKHGKINKVEFSRQIYYLIQENKIKLVENKKRSFISYFFSIENSWYLFSIIVITLSLISSILMSNKYILIKGIVVSPLLFFYPGYGIIESIYPKKEEWSELERGALSIGMSLAILPLLGLILNLLPIGLNVYSVSISIYIFTLAVLFIAKYRKYQYEKIRWVIKNES
ncbi:MAG: DUF1616 domain-containing protein [Candidatus Nanopusillus sp.]